MKPELVDLTQAVSALPNGASVSHFAGVLGSGAGLLARSLVRAGGNALLYVAPDADTAQRVRADLDYLMPGSRVLLLLASESNPFAETQPDRQAAMQRSSVLAELCQDEPWQILVVEARALVRKFVPRAAIARATVQVELEGELDPVWLARALTGTGYLRVPVVEDPGTFTIRGGLIDVWAAGSAEPVRIDLFGDLVSKLHSFDPESQRTRAELTRVRLPPAREHLLLDDADAERVASALRELCDEHNYPSQKTRQLVEDLVSGRGGFGVAGYLPAFHELDCLWRHLPPTVECLLEHPSEIVRQIETELELVTARATASTQPHFPVSALYAERDEIERWLGERRVVCCARSFVQGKPSSGLEALALVSEPPKDLGQEDHAEFAREVSAARSTRGKRAVLDPLIERLAAWHERGLDVTAVARNSTQARRLSSLLAHRGVSLVGSVAAEELELHGDVAIEATLGVVRVEIGALSRGVQAPLERLVLVTEEEIFGQRSHQTAARRKKSARALMEDLRALQPGDFVVHTEHGIGRYLGLENRVVPGAGQLELLVVEYLGGKLYLPVYRLNQIQKYSGGDSPKLDRLGGQTFNKSKARARRQAREMADELLRLFAERNNAIKEPLPPADDDYAAFEAAFPYEETSDQSAAIAEVLSDLEQAQVMDRLVCGDVGFGKTEVALRAAFRCASAGRQVAILCPTTVLAQQHYRTFSRRLEDTPFEVGVLSRFSSKKLASATLERLRKGTLDIVIGTHRLLSKDVVFRHLGLLVVDEEQRFGVAHKERLKQLRTQIDVLTLTATPIPRTLQLALGGLRQMSIIATPPVARRAIRTVVARADDGVLIEALERELARGGQVFYVHNRIEGLYERANRLQQLVPRARIGVAHGQVDEKTLERTMLDFVDGELDVLVSTAIVESGLDIPRANTILIDRADILGLAQLYQLRGRVGRAQVRGYCYLLVPPASEISDEARSRIEALERYTELGSGFQIATLDMELRGSGDLLGAEQSGPVASVGLELFCQMLEEATRELRGETVEHDVDPDLHFDVEALLPEDYIAEVGVRLSLYKRLASAHDENEVMQLGAEMEDRFGPAPEPAVRLVELMRLKMELRRLRVLVCEATSAGVSLRFRDDTPLDAAKLAALVAKQSAKYRLHPDGRLTRKPKPTEPQRDALALADAMLEELREHVHAA